MTLLLFKQIVSLFIMMAAGFALVKTKLVRSEESHVLSILSIYLIMPCTVIKAFQIEVTPAIQKGFLLAVAAAVLIHICLLLLDFGLHRIFKLNTVERTSIVYSNAGNLIIPLVTAILGIPLGIIAATHQNSIFDYIVTVVSMFFASMPNFWMALMMIIIFSLHLRWVPATGLATWKAWILPVLSLGLSPVASVTRMTRSSMLEVIRQDYIRTARAKGLEERTVIRRHALKNALINVVTVIGFQMSMIMGGSVIVESIFAIPGLGTYMMQGINTKDYPVVQGCVLVIALSVCIMNLLVDLFYGFIDPRVMAQYTAGKKKKEKAPKAAARGEAA